MDLFLPAYVWKNWVITGRSNGEFTALRLSDGKRDWGGEVRGHIASINGDRNSLFLGTVNGTVYRYAMPSSGQ